MNQFQKCKMLFEMDIVVFRNRSRQCYSLRE